MDCPNCGLINPDTAQRCDCGYDFVSKTQGIPLAQGSKTRSRSPNKAGRILGLLYLLHGLATGGVLFLLVLLNFQAASSESAPEIAAALLQPVPMLAMAYAERRRYRRRRLAALLLPLMILGLQFVRINSPQHGNLHGASLFLFFFATLQIYNLPGAFLLSMAGLVISVEEKS